MKDMVPKGTGNSRYLKSVANFLTLYPTYNDFVAALVAGTLPIDLNGINAAGCDEVGTPLNKANLLTDTTFAKMGVTIAGAEPTVDIALGILADKANEPNVSPIVVYRASDYSAGDVIYLAPDIVGKTILVLFDSLGNFGNLGLMMPSKGAVNVGAEFDVVCMKNKDCSGVLSILAPADVVFFASGNVLVTPGTGLPLKNEDATACVFKKMIGYASSIIGYDTWIAKGDF